MITEALLKAGFKRTKYNDYNLVLRIHDIHYLFWSDILNHFALGVKNVSNKKEPGGFFNECYTIVIPKPVYSVEGAMEIVKAITA
jgi:hypothetical protein